jgi:2-polyprenyl-3-methyl-5-hydroxy-6-metoxy-1,4-benzoquinol methylase
VEIRQADVDHLKRGEYENPRFWSRFGQVPDFRGAVILDVGSGWGSLCVDMALAGVKRVVGLEDYCIHNVYAILEQPKPTRGM